MSLILRSSDQNSLKHYIPLDLNILWFFQVELKAEGKGRRVVWTRKEESKGGRVKKTTDY
jgi:hypothetical protein